MHRAWLAQVGVIKIPDLAVLCEATGLLRAEFIGQIDEARIFATPDNLPYLLIRLKNGRAGEFRACNLVRKAWRANERIDGLAA